MEIFICLCSTIGMIAVVSLACLYLNDKFEFGKFMAGIYFFCFPIVALFFWFTSSSVTIDRRDLPEKLLLARDSLHKAKKLNDSLILVLDERRKENLINSLDNDTYKEVFGKDKPSTDENEGGETVFICSGSTSKRYHSDPDCRGLSNCTGEIEEVSEEEAEDMGRTPCQICY